jgi:hypothetical protein
VFGDLFTAGGYEIYLKPVTEYVPVGVDLPYQAVVESALRRNEVAIGFRIAAVARDPAAQFGVVINPRKSGVVRFAAGDKIVVLADD